MPRKPKHRKPPAPAPAPAPTPAPTPAPAPTQGSLGVYVNDDTPANVTLFEGWLGRKVDLVGAFVGHESWSDFNADWIVRMWAGLGKDVHFTLPPVVKGASLADAAIGKFDAQYTRVAGQIKVMPGDHPIFIRIGQEFNLDWSPWRAEGNEANSAKAHRRIVGCFRAVSPRFRFEWCPNWNGADPEPCYPGNDVVDVIGMDGYYQHEWDKIYTPTEAFNKKRDAPRGYAWQADFAKAQGKPIAFTEWGVDADGKGAFVVAMKAWQDAHSPAYQLYWNRTSGGISCRLSDNPSTKPQTAAAYKQAFGPA